MRTETKTVHLNAPRDDVFAFLSDVENLPLWATSFCREIKKEGNDYKAMTPMGEMFFAIHGDAATGVLDMASGPEKNQMAVWPARVTGLMDGSSVFAFTCVQFPGVEDDQFAQDCASVDGELSALQKRFA